MKSNVLSVLRLSNVYFALALVVAIAATAYGVTEARVLRLTKEAVSQNEQTVQLKSDDLKTLKDRYDTLAEDQTVRHEDLSRKIGDILPPNENYTDLTRSLDRYFDENDTPANPIFQSSLRFGKGVSTQEASDISALPFSMNIEGTRDNFFKFLDYIKNAGSLETGVRLMDIESIQLNFPEGGEIVRDLRQRINFTVDMNAYYHTPKVAR